MKNRGLLSRFVARNGVTNSTFYCIIVLAKNIRRIIFMKKAAISKDKVLKDVKTSPELMAIQKKVRESVIEQLVNKRKEKRMTQSDISVITGIQRPNISRLESGAYNPTLDMIVRIADSMDLDVKVVITRKSKSKHYV